MMNQLKVFVWVGIAGCILGSVLNQAEASHGTSQCADLFGVSQEPVLKTAFIQREAQVLLDNISKNSASEEISLFHRTGRVFGLEGKSSDGSTDRIYEQVLIPALQAYARYSLAQGSVGNAVQSLVARAVDMSAAQARNLQASRRPRAMTGEERREALENGNFYHVLSTQPTSSPSSKQDFLKNLTALMDPAAMAFGRFYESREGRPLTADHIRTVVADPLQFALVYARRTSLHSRLDVILRDSLAGQALRYWTDPVTLSAEAVQATDLYNELVTIAIESRKTHAEKSELDLLVISALNRGYRRR